MKYWKNITIDLSEINLRDATEKLMDLNILSISIRDKREPRYSDWFHESTEAVSFNSDTHQISLLVNGKNDIGTLLNSVRDALELDEPPNYVEEKIEDQDWDIYTQDQFNEIIISDRLRVIPPWVSRSNFNGITIVIQPGSGFGVGTHPTTQLCLGWLETNLIVGKSLLDYGSGSGILSIAGKKLGAGYTTGIEIDPKAIDNAKKNVLLNNLEIQYHDSDEQLLGQVFDNVIANILSDTLIDITPKLKLLTGKRLALSGILIDQADSVIDAFSKWIDLKPYAEKEGWVILDGIL